jgi:uncharacterized protein (TIGR00288 family)
MTTFVPRSPHFPGSAPVSPAARNAALLIDFDNITLGVRSDLGKELKTLLNSEIFSGKVAVRRAYADWRRYPNYVVPLTEASIDLIFAPAYGTSKKNATDLRMAVDAIELAFMRPEIGTFILLTGDSDFSSCVIKLKEYGKYVIGVGMRDSSSDLLIQNCDEYYSYHALSGLVREGDQTSQRRDPWLLVREAAQKMAAQGDNMRTDRLKQVMIDLDPNFDEKDEGYSKFSKFAQVAAEKGLIRLHKVENGQYEVAPVEDLDAAGPAPQPRYERERDDRYGRDRDRERGRGRGRERGRDRERPRDYGREREREFDREREPRAEPAPVRLVRDEEEPATAASVAESESETIAAAFPVGEPAAAEAPETPAAPATAEERDAISHAYALLQHAVRALVGRQGQTARDGDVKRRMLEMDAGFDEHALGFSKFSRFLRQAHEDQVVDVRRLAEGRYEVALPSAGTKLAPPTLTGSRPEPITVDRQREEQPRVAGETTAPETAEPRGRRDRSRGRGRGGRGEAPPAILPGQVPGAEEERPAAASAQPAPAAEQPAEARPQEPRREEPRREEPRREEPRPEERQPEAAAPPSSASREGPADAAARGLRHRHGGRRPAWASPSGPPPLLPGQVIHVPGVTRHEPPAPEPQAEPRAEEPAAEQQTPEPQQPAAPAEFRPADLGLPTDRAGVEAHLSGYRGVGAATVRSLAEAFGGRVFETLENDPDAVRSLLGRRAGPILDQWAADRDARRAERAQAPAAPAEQPAAEAATEAQDEDARDFAEAASAVAPEPAQDETDEGDEGGEAGTSEAAHRRRRRRGGRNRHRSRQAGDAEPAADTTLAPGGEVAAAADAVAAERAGTEPTFTTEPETAAAEEVETDATLASQAARSGGRSRGRRGRGRGGVPTDASAAETVDAGGVDIPVGAGGETDPTLMEQAAVPAGEAQPRGRSRGRGGRGRGGAEAAAPQPEAPAAPAPEQPAAGGGRRARGGRGAAQQATETALPAAPAAETGGGRRSRGGRGGGEQADAAPAAPAAEAPAGGGRRNRGGRGGAQPAPEAPAAPAAEGRGQGGRGRGGNRPAAEAPQAEPPAQGGEGGRSGGNRPRRGGRGRGGRGNAPPST